MFPLPGLFGPFGERFGDSLDGVLDGVPGDPGSFLEGVRLGVAGAAGVDARS